MFRLGVVLFCLCFALFMVGGAVNLIIRDVMGRKRLGAIKVVIMVACIVPVLCVPSVVLPIRGIKDINLVPSLVYKSSTNNATAVFLDDFYKNHWVFKSMVYYNATNIFVKETSGKNIWGCVVKDYKVITR